MTPGQLIYEARTTAGLTQAELAARLGVKLNTISRWELEYAEPPWRDVEKALAACGQRVKLTIQKLKD